MPLPSIGKHTGRLFYTLCLPNVVIVLMLQVMELRDFAERVLMSNSLEEKLRLSPAIITDDSPGKSITLPDKPGRPTELVMAPKDARASFPGLKHLESEEQRGKLLHFLANHELLATELMALVLLRFPEAPKEFRMGVYNTLKEEQAHTLMYMRRMKECGLHFGELPVNDYFWRMVSSMEQPIDFVTRLSLTFEQANLDFSKHYAGVFREAGDSGTATVLEKIYMDEIEHVGHGLKWFKLWKEKELSDWKAFTKQLSFPLVPSKAKGVAPFNREGRIAAGLDEEFVQNLEVMEGSRGRTPTITMFNPNAELHAVAEIRGKPFTPKKAELALEQDLEMLPMAWTRKDDVVLVNDLPRLEHLSYLRKAGIPQPEWVLKNQSLADRKLGGMRPWAWSSDASALLRKYASITFGGDGGGWREPLLPEAFGKNLGRKLLLSLQPDAVCEYCHSFCEVEKAVARIKGEVLMKAPYASAGRGHRKFIPSEGWVESVKNWVDNTITKQGYVIVEPFFDRVFDFSSQYEIDKEGNVKQKGMTRVINDSAGRFLGCFVHPKWAAGLNPELSEWLFRDAKVVYLYKHKLPELLVDFLQPFNYVGAFGIDAFVYRENDGSYGLRQVVELNMRFTMGRVALELLKSTQAIAGFYQILRKSKLNSSLEAWLEEKNALILNPTSKFGSVVLNDPEIAKEFYAIWHARKSWSEMKELVEVR